MPMMSICQPCRRGMARELLWGAGRRHGVPIANPRCCGPPPAIHRLRAARMCLPDILPGMVRILRQQGAPGRRGSGAWAPCPPSSRASPARAAGLAGHQERPETVRTGLALGFSHRPSPRAQQQPRGAACRAPHLGGGAEGDDGGEHVDETDGLRLRGVAGFNFFECVRVCA